MRDHLGKEKKGISQQEQESYRQDAWNPSQDERCGWPLGGITGSAIVTTTVVVIGSRRKTADRLA